MDSSWIAAGDAYKGRLRNHYTDYVIPRLRAGDMTGCILQGPGIWQNLTTTDDSLRWTRAQLAG